MSNYKTGDKFIIELGEQVGNLWKIKGFNALVFDDFGLDKLKQVIDCVAVDERKKGQQEAWKLMQEIQFGDFTQKQLTDIFGDCNPLATLKENTYDEAATKLKTWKERNEIHVGDVVIDPCGYKVLVTSVLDGGYNTLNSDGESAIYYSDAMAKTDRHIDIEAVLEQIK